MEHDSAGKIRPVVIVGGGPVGMLNALGLARQGIPVTVLERNADVARAPRAVVYHWATLEGLDRLGILAPAVEVGFKKKDYCFLNWSTGERVRYGLSTLEGTVAHPYNLHLAQDRLVDVVLDVIQRDSLPVDVRWSRNVVGLRDAGDRVVVTALLPDGSPERHTAAWVIGADGASSGVRNLLGMPFDGFTWPERFVATDVHYPFEEEGFDQTTFVVDEQYGAIIVKIDNSGDAGLWRYTYSDPVAESPESVEHRMRCFFDTLLPKEDRRKLQAYSTYKMHQRCAPAFRSNRVLLAGDAAHATNPTGGLGLTSGLFDTYLLVDALGSVVHGRSDDWVLDRYAHERRRVFKELVSPTASANKKFIFGSTATPDGAAAWARVRKLTDDEQAVRARLMFPRSLETPAFAAQEGR
ncbi:3-(3-hydroxy-phenyl)propionate hydroxylase/6-hydroxy-3-succinoylpyridine 3-monooxygenase [Amycolatopsis pretoriensis]|uniref:3-(3-hydroxy-phenyl)propionate hydroxylase/6-hydroxy-3-succinoylpyridine 3-monooxygenase n=1 Tax=Amycolatopsis pretoriensis TaxID=218821 RepID=A0A1H5R1P7_9PSEU|nr:FAD-dependent monooxygenase [Amycolatopsis pretoriensis]SEF32322.1 3-(3-hydroxy-phenyl)propionate hydroxylase/6-hydroxy-3-succinoylpyridine 3-monooxygenase [Amycolatopsis pretoriensis]